MCVWIVEFAAHSSAIRLLILSTLLKKKSSDSRKKIKTDWLGREVGSEV